MRFSTHRYSRITDGVAEIYCIQSPFEVDKYNGMDWLLFSGFGLHHTRRSDFTDLWIDTEEEIAQRWRDLHNLLDSQGWTLKSSLRDEVDGLGYMDPLTREDFRELILEMET